LKVEEKDKRFSPEDTENAEGTERREEQERTKKRTAKNQKKIRSKDRPLQRAGKDAGVTEDRGQE
jgi:hypothetical protein